jgi:hypothetical protein
MRAAANILGIVLALIALVWTVELFIWKVFG